MRWSVEEQTIPIPDTAFTGPLTSIRLSVDPNQSHLQMMELHSADVAYRLTFGAAATPTIEKIEPPKGEEGETPAVKGAADEHHSSHRSRSR